MTVELKAGCFGDAECKLCLTRLEKVCDGTATKHLQEVNTSPHSDTRCLLADRMSAKSYDRCDLFTLMAAQRKNKLDIANGIELPDCENIALRDLSRRFEKETQPWPYM